jgi:hypothetical protein
MNHKNQVTNKGLLLRRWLFRVVRFDRDGPPAHAMSGNVSPQHKQSDWPPTRAQHDAVCTMGAGAINEHLQVQVIILK